MTVHESLFFERNGDRFDVRSAPAAGSDRYAVRELQGSGIRGLLWGDAPVTGDLDTWIATLAKDAEAALADLRGAWALAAGLSDGRCVLAIDRLGRIPLYLDSRGGLLRAAPDLDALAAVADATPLSADALYAYVYHHMIPAPFCVLEGVRKLRAGEQSNGQVESAPHWHWKPAFSEAPVDLNKAGEEMRAVLKAAVGRALSPDRRCAAFLSGGLDSSTVTGFFSELTDRDCDAYSIGFDAEGYDEMAFARATAEHFGARLHEYYVTPEDVLEAIPELAAHFAEPFGNSSALPAYFCARRAAADGVEIMLAGDGGDELFAGNERYAKQTTFERYLRTPAPLRHLVDGAVSITPASVPLATKAHSFLRQVNTPMPRRLFYYSFLEQHPAGEVFTASFLEAVDTARPQAELARTYARANGASTLNKMLNLDWQITLADNDLRKVNGACARAGVEVRYPMLDDALLDLSLRIPSSDKLRGGDLRYFFRENLRDWLPETTINKSKQGFGLPFGVWMREYAPLRDFAYDTAHALGRRGVLKAQFVDDTIRHHRSGHASYYGELLWIMCTLELWLGHHFPEYRCE